MPSSDIRTSVSFKDFQQLSPTISLYRPSDSNTKSHPATPQDRSLIILAPWLSAQPRHITKYTDAYQSLFPNASILVICTTAADMVYRSYHSQQEDLNTVLPVLQANDDNGELDILLHMFSNAGAHKASQIARAHQGQTKTTLKCGVMVFDSTPGIATYSRIVDAMTVGLPTIPILRQLLACVVHLLVALIWLHIHCWRPKFGGEGEDGLE
ncbi:hypothetical protein ONS95_003039 [Cadophora gregata]|uniref:uncharacterized protein n=1 Tax=Cadophora gregata TaxID=51156 RepID=UPI0026DAFB3C|nr:uncharacterized protein ONS95_003039 [Cadophora gregata]KAK0108219.1 hypothetical protein ONS95_003039 [Cadophora gregata]KAK0109190.1 hypothetical protein ONS96_003013 [Cadophora gregata f. sp. sojae]